MFDVLITCFYISLCLIFISKSKYIRSSSIPLHQLYSFFLIQLLASFALYFVYTKIYTVRKEADIFKFYDDATFLYHQIYAKSPIDYFKFLAGFENTELIKVSLRETDFWYKPFDTSLFNDNRTIIRINAFICLFSNCTYAVHSVLFTFLSFIGLISMYKSFLSFFTNKELFLKIACFGIPSIIFWTSGILKESVLIFALGLFTYHIFKLFENRSSFYTRSLWLIIPICLLLFTKTYVLFALLPGTIAVFIWKTNLIKKLSLAYLTTFILLAIVVLIPIKFFCHFDLIHALVKMQQDFIHVARDSHSSSFYEISLLNESIWSVIVNSPEALFNVLCRPLFTGNSSALTLIASMENTAILLLILYTIVYKRKFQDQMKSLALFSISFILILFILIGLTVPVEGAIVRYKVPALPFLLIFLFSFLDLNNLHIRTLFKNIWKKESH